MISHISSKSQPGVRQLMRDRMLSMLEIGLEVKAYRFTRQAALAWLTSFPGDLEVNLYYAKALVKEDRYGHAVPVVQKILHADPEYLQAALLAEIIYERGKPELLSMSSGIVRALGGSPVHREAVPEWGELLNQIRQEISKGNLNVAQTQLMQILGKTEHIELSAIAHLQIAKGLEDPQSLLNLARLYHSRLPDCIQISLILALALMDNGEEDEAVSLLHFSAACDPNGQVPSRMWGHNFPYKPLYPSELSIEFDLQVPAEVSVRLGMNQLGPGKTSSQEDPRIVERTDVKAFDGFRVIPTERMSYPEHPGKAKEIKPKSAEVMEIENNLKKVAERIGQPVVNNTDERFPAHIILTMKSGLRKQYGDQSTQVILDEMERLTKVIRNRVGWSSILFMPDELSICGKYDIAPVDSSDPWKIKLALVDLDKALARTGERIGSVLIVGGDKVVPYHRLPNPTDDADAEVPSDSPYGAVDTNYFVSDWSVGRLPGEEGSDAGLLVSQLRGLTQSHEADSITPDWLSSLLGWLFFWQSPIVRNFSNTGYSASIWRRSSLAVFRPIGEGRNLFLSPNNKGIAFDVRKFGQGEIGYFNVHGVEDGAEWYGQKDPVENDNGPDFPIALKPGDLRKTNSIPSIVFSEACYGGHIFGKREDDSIALTLIGKGVQAFIGSTTISYGSVTTPLIGADLFGYLIFSGLRDGLSVGAALLKAKVEFIREMNRRQGYLDGEDQKTLISFVLYGDPLATYNPNQSIRKIAPREVTHISVKTITDNPALDEQTQKLAPALLSKAKNLVKDYLPGIEYAEVRIRNQQLNQNGLNGIGKNAKINEVATGRVTISFSKQVTQAERIHRQYARVTLDKEGKAIKVAVSR